MHELILPSEVKISEIMENTSLSPNNYKKLTIHNQKRHNVSYYMNEESPYQKGIEPGSSSYVSGSSQYFLRNSCINNIQFSVDKSKYICLNPKYYSDCVIEDGDVLFCTDANIGDCCLFISDEESVNFSSGMIKLNFKEEKYKYYVMAFLRDDYFREQLNAKTPKGATIRHSGDLFLECEIPDAPDEWVYCLTQALIKNIAFAEHISNSKLRKSESLLYDELMTCNYEYDNPSINQLQKKARLDSGIYSNTVFQWRKNIENFKNGFTDLDGFGFKTQRGPSLQVRDLGRSIQTSTYRNGYNILIYPSDISSSGYVEKVTYLGARNPIWFLSEKYILFASEGTIGKTFIVCDDTMHFTTNIHGTMIYPKDMSTDIKYSIFLGLYLNWLRSNEVLLKLSVGANGGSFAVGYWDNILIPKVDEGFMDKLVMLYNNNSKLNPAVFDLDLLNKAGIYQLNSFLIKCKALLHQLCHDIKEDQLQSKSFYMNYISI